ncbi:MAG: hypothetical protein CL865_01715 [Cycloclasticus sp.]|nr:hypothetical protein [Cycloclasticus sp.]|tara:strand:+ start:13288 stop:14616 length:1329 start_codon:yes stop_codon:yes gene_type:complete
MSKENRRETGTYNLEIDGGRRRFLSSAGIATGGLLASGLSVPGSANAKVSIDYPDETVPAPMRFLGGEYSLAERDLRWEKIRHMMKELGLDCLIIPAGAGDSYVNYAGYVSNAGFMNPGAVILPLREEPTIYGTLPMPSQWISNVGEKGVPLGEAIAYRLNELALGSKNIGVVGTKGKVFGLNEFTDQGLVTYSAWQHVIDKLPKASFVDVTPQLALLMLVRTQEEIKAYERTAAVGENLHRLLLDYVKPGISDRDLRSLVAEHMIRSRATVDVDALEMRQGIVQKGDIINSEYGIHHRGGYTQSTLCMSVGAPDKQTAALAEVAHECMQVGLGRLKPGVKFGEVIERMEKVIIDAGYWHGFPVLHSLGPLVLVGPVAWFPPPAKPDEILGADVVIKEGMIFSFEPGARVGSSAQVKVGGSGVVTATGVRMFNSLGTRMRIV